ncbi:MAG TPA: ATP-dependent DNA ligase [Stellaceae bacterium]|nr:ATP-dependent DNA ligase [Stellaceae bacterium]
MAATADNFPLPLETAPMEALTADTLPHGQSWQYEPKWDGFRCLAFRAGSAVELRGKSGKPLARYFPEIAAMLRGLKPDRFVADGELAVPIGDTLSFGALQMRLHPSARRVGKLACETPAILILFDLLAAPGGAVLLHRPLAQRREALDELYDTVGTGRGLELSPYTLDPATARRWLDIGGGLDGVVAKRRDGNYRSGERAMLKVKRQRTADCVVGGFRYERDTRRVGSLLLGLYNDEGHLDHVGFTATFSGLDRDELTRELERLVEPPGFTGAAPGGPSRWSTARSAEWRPVRPVLVAEVRYDQVTDNRFRHGTRFMRWRPDKAPRQCTFDQLPHREAAQRLIAGLLPRDRQPVLAVEHR